MIKSLLACSPDFLGQALDGHNKWINQEEIGPLAAVVLCRLHVLVVLLLHNVRVNVCWAGLSPTVLCQTTPKKPPVCSCGLCIWSLVNKSSRSVALREDFSSIHPRIILLKVVCTCVVSMCDIPLLVMWEKVVCDVQSSQNTNWRQSCAGAGGVQCVLLNLSGGRCAAFPVELALPQWLPA